jgi:hypothetical protein
MNYKTPVITRRREPHDITSIHRQYNLSQPYLMCPPNAMPQYTNVKEPSMLVESHHCERSDHDSIGLQWRARRKVEGVAARLYKRLCIGGSYRHRAAWRAVESEDFPVKLIKTSSLLKIAEMRILSPLGPSYGEVGFLTIMCALSYCANRHGDLIVAQSDLVVIFEGVLDIPRRLRWL